MGNLLYFDKPYQLQVGTTGRYLETCPSLVAVDSLHPFNAVPALTAVGDATLSTYSFDSNDAVRTQTAIDCVASGNKMAIFDSYYGYLGEFRQSTYQGFLANPQQWRIWAYSFWDGTQLADGQCITSWDEIEVVYYWPGMSLTVDTGDSDSCASWQAAGSVGYQSPAHRVNHGYGMRFKVETPEWRPWDYENGRRTPWMLAARHTVAPVVARVMFPWRWWLLAAALLVFAVMARRARAKGCCRGKCRKSGDAREAEMTPLLAGADRA